MSRAQTSEATSVARRKCFMGPPWEGRLTPKGSPGRTMAQKAGRRNPDRDERSVHLLAHDGPLGGAGLVEPPHRRRVRRRARDLRILLGLAHDRADRLGERVERLAR